MSPRPNFLSPLLNLDGIWEERLIELYEIFVRDFIQNPCYYEKKKIVFNRNKSINGKKEDGFWHLITYEDKIYGRIPEFKRAKRLHWIRPIIENYNNPSIINFDYLEGNNKIRKYLWLKNNNFVVILEWGRKKGYFFLMTAFYCSESKKKDLQRRYRKRML